MDKKNTLVVTILAVVVLLVLVLTATFAYFAATIDANTSNSVIINANLPASDTSLIVASTGGIDIDLTSSDMLQANANNETAKDGGNQNITLTLKGGSSGNAVTCTYGLEFAWTSTDKYTAPSSALTSAGKEFTINISSACNSGSGCAASTLPSTGGEKNIASSTTVSGMLPVGASTTNKIDGSTQKYTISSQDATNPTVVTINVESKLYNVEGVDQSAVLGNKHFKGQVTVTGVQC